MKLLGGSLRELSRRPIDPTWRFSFKEYSFY